MSRYVLLLLLAIPLVHAATIEGSVYDLSLDTVGAVVEVNTEPLQRMVAKDGKYTFIISPGDYQLTAKGLNGDLAQENITIAAEGVYTIDLFLYPDIEGVDLGDEPPFDLVVDEPNYWPWSIAIGMVIVFIALLSWKMGKQKNEPDQTGESPQEILAILKANDGRMTQKALRDKLPHSEAKVSLMIAELEAKGKIEKIKRGRSNLLLLK